MRWVKVLVATVTLAVVIAGCRRYTIPPVVIADVALPPEARAGTPEPVLLLPDDSSDYIYEGLNMQGSVLSFYELMHYRPVWASRPPANNLADSMLHEIQNIRYRGLLPDRYHLAELTNQGIGEDPTRWLLRRDVLLTDAFLSVAKDLRSGVLRKQTAMDDSLQRLMLVSVVKDGALQQILTRLEPAEEAYQLLKAGLQVVLDTVNIQHRSLLLAGTTIDSLPTHQKIQVIEINMERWRWESPLGSRYILVNIPAFMAVVKDRDTVVLESKVIVGRPQNPTPQLTSSIQCFITYPYWHVPRKIAVDELLPLIVRDPGYIERNNFDVLDRKGRLLDPDSVEWATFHSNNFPVVLRQREGADNSLGVLKFVFDNPYAVFLHDTNARRLFERNARAFSHGCIRMEKAVDFANYLVTGDVRKKSEAVQKLLHQKERNTVDVPHPINIYVRYFTAEARGGQLFFYQDLYKKDQVLINSLYRPGVPFVY